MRKILVIEDEHPVLDNVLEILAMEGYEALGADNGRDGIALAEDHIPDLVLCDIMMPDVDGYQVLLALRDDPATTAIPFIFLTAKADRTDLRLGMELGADDYITKPFRSAELLSAVQTRLDRQDEINQRYEQRLADLRGNIFYMLPHELRTPLVSVIGYAELLMMDAETVSPEQVKSMANSILRAGQRLHRTTENFLVYMQLELMRSDPERAAQLREHILTAPDDRVRQMAQECATRRDRIADLQLSLETVGAAAEPALRMAGENFDKVVTELVDNALKFSRAHTPVHVTTHRHDTVYEFTVRDEGRGMTPDQVHDIGIGMQFNRRIYEQQGAGVGLALAQRMVELHGGEFSIQSQLNHGTTVRVRLPLA